MRINKYIALHSLLSRRAADAAIAEGRVLVNGQVPQPGQDITDADQLTVDGRIIDGEVKFQTILLNKPAGYIVSRDGQGAPTVYDLLPAELHHLKPVGRLDKDSSGLLLMTNDGQLAQQLTHPSHQKAKVYQVALSTPLQPLHRQMISDYGITLEDGPSKFQLERLTDGDEHGWQVTMHEGRNRQIRRTFSALGYTVTSLHRIQFGSYSLQSVRSGEWIDA